MIYFGGDWETDNKIMEGFLSKMDIVSGSLRNKMLYVNKNIGGSALYGSTWKSYMSPTKSRPPNARFTGLFDTKLVTNHPEMEMIFKEFSGLYFPDLFWTQVQINKNYQTPEHTDSDNTGESVLCAFGTFEGGKTRVDFGGMGKCSYCYLNPRVRPVRFDGSKFPHRTEPFIGTRYSLVFYNNIKNIRKKLINPDDCKDIPDYVK